MSYNRDDLEKIIEGSCTKLRGRQPILFDPESDVNERTVSGELAGIIREQIKGLHVNCEYNRMTDEHGMQIPKRIKLDPNNPNPSTVFPDIIIHRQENGENNLLVVEIKMAWKNDKKERDFYKLNRYMEELGYQYGLYLELDSNGISEMQWF